MDGLLWSDSRYDLASFRAATTPPAFVNVLAAQQVPRDAALLAFLEKHIPEPQTLVAGGIAELAFYNQLASYYATNQADFAPFDSVAVTDALMTELFAPLTQAQALFDSFPYLTRLSTVISPAEMTKDPLFLFNADLGDVASTHQAQVVYQCGNMMYSRCNAPARLTLPDGTVVQLASPGASGNCFGTPGATLPSAVAAQMPSLAMAWQRRSTGEGIVTADNSATIAKSIAASNASLNSNGCACAVVPARSAGLAGVGALVAVAALLRVRRRRCR
jgi:MYXO-CTERM domain-containing protein